MWSWGGADVSVFTRVSGLGATLGYDGALRARNVRLAGQVHVNYRMATFEDVPRLAAARWAFRRESGEAPVETETAFAGRFERFATEALASGRWTYWIAETDDGTLTSQMAVCVVESVPRPSRASDQWGYLTDCYTSPAFRNEGVGRELLARVATWAKSRDLELLLVWPSDESQRFYARAGFDRDEEIRVLRLREYDASPGSL
jgi:GNAT superfamily N-acetyltransferase